MGHDIFVSYSAKDKPSADAVVAALERAGVRCWYAPRDILLGEEWPSAILRGINGCRLMLLVFSSHANTSKQIQREIERAVHRELPLLPVRIENVLPAGALEYFLSSSHWLDAMTPPFERHLEQLVRQVKTLLGPVNSESPAPQARDAVESPVTPVELPVTPVAPAPKPVEPPRKQSVLGPVFLILLLVGVIAGIVWILNSRKTVSTDDAYVNGQITFVAPRVSGQVIRVLVDDNDRVHKGDLLVQLDKEPYQVQVNIAQTAVTAAEADLVARQAQVRATEMQMRSLRFNLEHAIEDVDNQIAVLRSRVAIVESKKTSLAKAQADYDRAVPLVKSGAISQQDIDTRAEALQVAQANLQEALQGVYEIRVALGLSPKPETGDDLTQVPPDLDQTFLTVRQAQNNFIQAEAQIGVTDSFNKTPKQTVADFFKRDPSGDIDVINTKLLLDAPSVKLAEAKQAEAQRNLDQAELNLRYCDVVAEIDGVVTRRDVNPGINVIAGQSLMALR